LPSGSSRESGAAEPPVRPAGAGNTLPTDGGEELDCGTGACAVGAAFVGALLSADFGAVASPPAGALPIGPEARVDGPPDSK
jgi:hypothetical protein